MNTSDWIALAAAAAAFIGLIPQFAQMTRERNGKTKTEQASANSQSSPDETTQAASTPSASLPAEPSKPVKLNALGRALVLTSMGIAIGVVELVLFSTAAAFMGVEVNSATMPTNWLVVFYALFLLPGVCLVFAFFNIVSVLE